MSVKAPVKPGDAALVAMSPEEMELEIERRVNSRMKEVQQKTYYGWIIRAPLFGKKALDGTPLAVTEQLTVHSHQALVNEVCRQHKCKHKPLASEEDGGCPTRLVQSPPIDMYAGQGVTDDELVALWCRDYMGYTIMPADLDTNSLARTAALASAVGE